MALSVVDLLKSHFHLTSPLPIVLAGAAVVGWLYLRPAARGPRRLLVALLVCYWIAATPLGARGLAGLIGYGFASLPDAAAAGGADTIVVMGGGEESFQVDGLTVSQPTAQSALRALEGARVYRLLGRGTVVATGGRLAREGQLVPEAEVLTRALVEAGVPVDHIVAESRSLTTREQAVNVGALLRARGTNRFVLVTSEMHMRRAQATFRAQGFDPIPSVSPLRSGQLGRSPLLLPSGEWLAVSDMAVYDAAALAYYRLKGWI